MSDETTFEFHSPNSLLAVANRNELQADEKPLYAPQSDSDDPAGMMHATDGESVSLTRVDGHKAVFNPETGRVFNTVTDEYEIINPPEFIGPLAQALTERDRTDITGDVWVRNDGGSAYAQVLFENTHTIHLPGRGRTNPVRCGFTLRWSHDNGMSVKARGFAQDTACKNSIRQITSPIHVKHSGDVDERVDWDAEWAGVLDELGAFSEALAGVIEDAMNTDLFDLSDDLPGTLRDAADPLDTIENVDLPGPVTERDRDALYGFYETLGLPKYLAVSAVDRLMWRAGRTDDPRVLSAWDAYSAATYALTHDGRGTPGASDDDYHRTVKDILLNPVQTRSRTEQQARAACAPDDADQSAVENHVGDVEGSVGEALRTESERARVLEGTFGGD